ncbi:MAG: TM0996/MTH895 family glutaredoxin-like protein [Cyclobacteriaceae bacterium]|nr:TM0996/MTH895 family glutaredoxin-like protein [Cyclobacteriaceae bacterium]
MKTVKILGTGCPKCKNLEANARKAIEELGIQAEVIKVDQIDQILAYNIFSTPALVIDEVVKVKGRLADVKEIKSLLN